MEGAEGWGARLAAWAEAAWIWTGQALAAAIVAVREGWTDLRAWWAGLPPLPEMDLPPLPDPPVMVVAATTILALGLVGLFSGWSERRLSVAGLAATVVAAGLWLWIWDADREGFSLRVVPEAVVEIVARVIR